MKNYLLVLFILIFTISYSSNKFQITQTIKGEKTVNSLIYIDSKTVCYHNDYKIFVKNTETAEIISSFTYNNEGNDLKIFKMCNIGHIIAVSYEKTGNVLLFNTITGKRHPNMLDTKYSSYLFCLDNNQLVASSSYEYKTYIWNIQSGKTNIINLRFKKLVNLGNGIVAIEQGLELVLFNLNTMETKKTIKLNDPIDSISSISSEENLILYSAGTVCLLNTSTEEKEVLLEKEYNIDKEIIYIGNDTITYINNPKNCQSAIKSFNIVTKEKNEILKTDNCHLSFKFNNENEIITFDKKQKLKIWNVTTNKLVRDINGHTEAIISLAYLGNNTLASSTKDETIIWNLTNKSIKKYIKNFKTSSTLLINLGNNLIGITNQEKINIFNTETFDYLDSLSVKSIVSSIVYVDSERLGCSNDNTFTLFNYKSGQKLKTVEFESNINDLVYMNNDTMLIVLKNKSAVFFDLNSGKKKIITTDDTIFYGCDLENGVILLTTIQNPSFIIRYDIRKDTKEIINTGNIIYDSILKLNDKEFITSSSLSPNIGIWSINGYKLLDHYEDFRTQVLTKVDSNKFIGASDEIIVVYERIEKNNIIKYLQ